MKLRLIVDCTTYPGPSISNSHLAFRAHTTQQPPTISRESPHVTPIFRWILLCRC
ncbi:Protein of unknown function [Pyronema omphalodes CBS 100304]|uniref:Uncharacterized protein n=1 Tax=Pyronema omphalodes (strain CBS 100304) TaxID=1076935 RepID=U4LJS8_PYROM|nr:Protein of unknown function [Pyronema omphalodes CBS 100304]